MRVEVEVALLHVLAVVALGAGEAEEALLQDRVASRSRARARSRADWWRSQMPGEAVLAPAVGPRCGRGRAGSSPRRRRRRCSPRAPCPMRARSGRAPSASSCASASRPPRGAVARGRGSVRHAGAWMSPGARGFRLAEPGPGSTRSIRSSSPTDQAWNGQPRGVCGASPSAISETWPRPASSRCASSGARKRSRASRSGRGRAAADAHPRLDEGAGEPRPDGALVVARRRAARTSPS